MYYDLRYHSLGHKEKVPLLSTRWRVYMRKWRGMHWVGAGKLGHEETPQRMTNSRLMKTFSLTLIKAKLLSLYKKKIIIIQRKGTCTLKWHLRDDTGSARRTSIQSILLYLGNVFTSPCLFSLLGRLFKSTGNTGIGAAMSVVDGT